MDLERQGVFHLLGQQCQVEDVLDGVDIVECQALEVQFVDFLNILAVILAIDS